MLYNRYNRLMVYNRYGTTDLTFIMCDRVGGFIFTKMTSSDEIQLEKRGASAWKAWLQDNLFLMYTLSGVFIGIILGFILRPMNLGPDAILLISYPGEIFMRVLKLMILPFVISCLITGTATLNIGKNGRIAVRTFSYFVSTSALNVCLGMLLVLIIHPGDPGVRQQTTPVMDVKKLNIIDGFLDMGRNLVPDNIFQAAFEQTYTEYVPVEPQPSEMASNGISSKNSSNHTAIDDSAPKMKRQLQFRSGTNTLGIIFFCMIFGSVLGTLGPQKHIIIDFFSVVYQVLLKMLMGAIWLTPLGVGSIICAKIITIVNLSQTLLQLSWFIFTVALGVLIYQFVIIQLIYYLIVRKNPYQYYLTFGPSIITAFATASKAAALPLTFQIMDEKVKASERITRFVLPIGTLNMDGTALFITVATAFLAQINNIPLGVNEILTLG
ncbi:excitatory amino acid transporter 2 isoform X1 [Nilaparvata lugens]|uniref:excitatory amino acid transporter 2 isoform X1 n=3 Tax=Nilaparvata lugens TaxID=108931 RepID=UPI00193DB438|nr:excitatory amino acid transporter 2 isoform X1 [Nilaparvata lugens]